MAKRFMDTELWEKEWFGELNTKQKLLVYYLFSHCDCAGVYEANYRSINFYTGEKITEDDILKIKQVVKLANGKFFITDFIKFQYGADIENLNPNFTVHRGVIKILEKNEIFKSIEEIKNSATSETVRKELEKSLGTVQHKDKDKDKDKDNTTNSNSNNKEKSEKKFGEFNNIVLSEAEEKKLRELYKDDFDEAIGYLASYIQASGKKYKSHYAVLGKHNWVYKKVYEEKGVGTGTKKTQYADKRSILRQAGEIF